MSKNPVQFGVVHVRQMSKDEIEQVVLEYFTNNNYIKNRSDLHNSVHNKFKARGGNSVSPHELFEMLSYSGRLGNAMF